MPGSPLGLAQHNWRPSEGLTFLQALLLFLTAVVGLMPHSALLCMLLQLLGCPTLALEPAMPVSAQAGQPTVSHLLAAAGKEICRLHLHIALTTGVLLLQLWQHLDFMSAGNAMLQQAGKLSYKFADPVQLSTDACSGPED